MNISKNRAVPADCLRRNKGGITMKKDFELSTLWPLLVVLPVLVFLVNYELEKRLHLAAEIDMATWSRNCPQDWLANPRIGVPYDISHASLTDIDLNTNKTYFAIRGMKCTKFKPWNFHYVYADIIMREADTNEVYIYYYHPRYKTTLDIP